MRHAERRRQTVMAGIWRQRQIPTGYEFAGPGRSRRPLSRDGAEARAERARRRRARGVQARRTRASRHAGRTGARDDVHGRAGAARATGSIWASCVTAAAVSATGRSRRCTSTGPRMTRSSRSSCSSACSGARGRRAARPRARRRAPSLRCSRASTRCASCSHGMSRRMTKGIGYGCHREHSDGRCPAPASITLDVARRLRRAISCARQSTGWSADLGVDPAARLEAAEAELEQARGDRKRGRREPDPRRASARTTPTRSSRSPSSTPRSPRLERRVAEVAATVPAARSFADGSRAIETDEDLRQAVIEMVGHVVVRPRVAGGVSRSPTA